MRINYNERVIVVKYEMHLHNEICITYEILDTKCRSILCSEGMVDQWSNTMIYKYYFRSSNCLKHNF